MAVIVISGAIGSGKSSLTALLAEEFGMEAKYESVDDNEVLPLYYSNMEKYALLLQIYFLNNRFKIIKESFGKNNTINDRSIYEDSLFFHKLADDGIVSETEVKIYDDLLENMMQEINESHKKAPDLLIHIDVSLETTLERIQKRGREFEQLDNNPELFEYYSDLNSRYVRWYEEYNHSPKISISDMDFVNNEQDRINVITIVRNKLQELNLL